MALSPQASCMTEWELSSFPNFVWHLSHILDGTLLFHILACVLQVLVLSGLPILVCHASEGSTSRYFFAEVIEE